MRAVQENKKKKRTESAWERRKPIESAKSRRDLGFRNEDVVQPTGDKTRGR